MNFVGLKSAGLLRRRRALRLTISHPATADDAALYAGFPWKDADGEHESMIWKSTDDGASWTETNPGDDGPNGEADSVENYCDIQCTYDNVVEADPNHPNVVYAAGEYGYDLHPQSGGIYRSDDGGQTWQNLGWDLHPDFHALAWDPTHDGHVAIGNDGGVMKTTDLGGRPTRETPLNQNHWTELNSAGLAIAQFSSIATNPTRTARLWGGTQDNGTQRKSSTSNSWFDVTSATAARCWSTRPTSTTCTAPTTASRRSGSPTAATAFFTNQSITHGINLGDRSEFYTPWVLNQDERQPAASWAPTASTARTTRRRRPRAT